MWLPVSLLAVAKIGLGLALWLSELGGGSGAGPMPAWVYAVLVAVFGSTGAYLIVSGRNDEKAIYLGACHLAFVTLFADRLIEQYVGSQPAPGLVFQEARLLRPEVFAPVFLWRFTQQFSGTGPWRGQSAATVDAVMVVLSTLLFVLAGVPGLGALAGGTSATWARAFDPARVQGVFWVALSLMALPSLAVLVMGLGRLGADRRRRTRLFVAGLIAGTLPMVADVLLTSIVPPYARFFDEPARSRTLAAAIVGSICVLPVTTAYAVTVGKVFDLRIYVRKAIQYALARYTVLGLLALHAIGISVFLWQRRAEPLTTVLLDAPIEVGVLLVSGVLLLACRGFLLSTIDWWFFREQYDAKRILLSLSEGLRTAEADDQIASVVSAEIERALHLTSASLLLQRDDSGLGAPGMPTLRTGTALAQLLAGSAAPLDVDLAHPRSTLLRLPSAEREWLADTGGVLLVPLLSARGSALLGVLVLGEKRSEAPYTTEDRELLRIVAASAALSLENKGHATPAPVTPAASTPVEDRGGAWECATCGWLGDSEGMCAQCGGQTLPTPLPRLVNAHVRIERRIGRGGMGVVYLGRDLLLNRTVAIKTLPRLTEIDASRMRREGRAMASLHHSHLATIYGADTCRGYPVLVLEFLEGGTVADRLRRGALTPVEVADLGEAVARALEYLHAKGFLHRDVKPSNIGYTAEGIPKLLDFGLARLTASDGGLPGDATTAAVPKGMGSTGREFDSLRQTAGPRIAGTPAYLSPEVLAGRPAAPADDLWALAVSLFECLAGANPFQGEDVISTVARISAGQRPDLCRLRADCPERVEQFFARALAPDAAQRPRSAAEFGGALRAWRPL